MDWQPRERWAAGALVALVGLGALILGYRQYRAEQSEVQTALRPEPVPAAAAEGNHPEVAGAVSFRDKTAASGSVPEAGAADEVVVHVSGAVERPGVYRLKAGARVHDAVLAAGPLPEAASHALNLAARLRDGEKIYVPAVGDLANEGGGLPVEALGASHRPGGEPEAGAPGARVNVNRAGVEELTAVPGIGPALAQRIVEYRQQAGGFSQVEDLLGVRGIGPAKLAQVKEYLEAP